MSEYMAREKTLRRLNRQAACQPAAPRPSLSADPKVSLPRLRGLLVSGPLLADFHSDPLSCRQEYHKVSPYRARGLEHVSSRIYGGNKETGIFSLWNVASKGCIQDIELKEILVLIC